MASNYTGDIFATFFFCMHKLCVFGFGQHNTAMARWELTNGRRFLFFFLFASLTWFFSYLQYIDFCITKSNRSEDGMNASG